MGEEYQLQHQNEDLKEFAQLVSHDLRNHLFVARSRTELIKLEYDSEHLHALRRAHDRIGTLIEDLSRLAQEGKWSAENEPIVLAEAIQACWQTVESGSATLSVATDRTILADRNRLGQLLENIFRNAVKHAGRDVTVVVGDLPEGFYVEDDGPGIPESEREHIFEAGYTTSSEGTGLGLQIVKQVAEAHGWTISVAESAFGGARFDITGVDSNP